MTFKTILGGTTGIRFLFKSDILCVLICALLWPMSITTSSAAQIMSSAIESNEIDGSGIINTPNHNSSSNLRSIPYVGGSKTPLPIGRLCENDSDCANFSICRLVIFDKETTKKICECDMIEMKQVNSSCYIKPGHQCYYPNKNSHGYSFIPCLPGSVCKSSVNKAFPQNGYCMCKAPAVEENFRYVNVDFEMARCSANSLVAFIGMHSIECMVLGMITLRSFFDILFSSR